MMPPSFVYIVTTSLLGIPKWNVSSIDVSDVTCGGSLGAFGARVLAARAGTPATLAAATPKATAERRSKPRVRFIECPSLDGRSNTMDPSRVCTAAADPAPILPDVGVGRRPLLG